MYFTSIPFKMAFSFVCYTSLVYQWVTYQAFNSRNGDDRSLQCLTEKRLSLILWLDASAYRMCLLYGCVGLLSMCLCAFVCVNYWDLNAGSAGETGCLLINEWSRWPWVGGSCKHTASRSGGQHNRDTWAITNKTSQAADTGQRYKTCVCVCLHIFL